MGDAISWTNNSFADAMKTFSAKPPDPDPKLVNKGGNVGGGDVAVNDIIGGNKESNFWGENVVKDLSDWESIWNN